MRSTFQHGSEPYENSNMVGSPKCELTDMMCKVHEKLINIGTNFEFQHGSAHMRIYKQMVQGQCRFINLWTNLEFQGSDPYEN